MSARIDLEEYVQSLIDKGIDPIQAREIARKTAGKTGDLFETAATKPPTKPAPKRTPRSAVVETPSRDESVAVIFGVGARGVVPSTNGVAMGGAVVGLGVAGGSARCTAGKPWALPTPAPVAGGSGAGGQRPPPALRLSKGVGTSKNPKFPVNPAASR